ncbi:hypothetical protein RHSIM_Rhsim10G0182900 [Rhododendron simsii]|uniref:Uncharacterized protein n=1 Tax=Rhododendron simsii TaxID=118357 RepID=A0A834LDX9_RHOSS|nr:hypothetical protein RHSIM_Rhsim10G0182900 [Rhododendron simsii]
MAEAKIKYGSKKFKKMLIELYKEAVELSNDHNCKVGIFVAPKKIDEKSTMYAFGSPSVESVMEELKVKAKEEKKKKKKFMAKIKRKAKLNILEGNCATRVCGCKLGGARVTEEDAASVKHEGN